jgi:nucleoside-diphosphate-sugar epimerase
MHKLNPLLSTINNLNFNMKNILVAGGAGYIGTRLCNELVESAKVTVVDLFWFGDHLDGRISKLKKNIAELQVSDLEGFDVVLFLGGLSNDPMAHFRPDLNFSENSSVPTYLAYIAKQAGVRRFICASSCSVYGFTNNQKLTETDSVKPSYAYGISKLQCELGVMTLEDENFRPILFRKGTVGGFSPRMRYDLVVNTMIMSGITKKRITVNNHKLWRPLIDIRDVIQGYKLAIDADNSVSGVFNLAGGNYTIGHLGAIVQSTLESRGYRVDLDLLEINDMRNYLVDTTKIETALGFKAQYKPQDTAADILDNINAEAYDFTKSEYYNINTFKQVLTL